LNLADNGGLLPTATTASLKTCLMQGFKIAEEKVCHDIFIKFRYSDSSIFPLENFIDFS